MKSFKPYIPAIALLIIATGCAFYPTASRTVAISGGIKDDAVLEAAVETAQSIGFPTMTKMDKADGIVEFGSFEGPQLGISAQVRVLPDNKAEITVKRGSVYIPFGTDKEADEFRAKLDERLQEMEQKAAKQN